MTNHYFEKIFDPVHRFLDSSVGRADGFKAESCGSNLTLLKLFFSYFSKNFMTKKISFWLIFLLKTFCRMVLEAQKPLIIWICA